MEHPVGAGVPGALQQFVAQLFRLLRLAVGTDHGAQARFADVGMREADEHRRRQHALRLQRDAALLQRFVGFGVRALAHHVRQHGLVAPAHDGLDLALERAHDDVGRAQPGGVDVHVRIGMEAADDGGVPDDVVVEVGVHVQRHRHRRRRIDLAQAAQQVAPASSTPRPPWRRAGPAGWRRSRRARPRPAPAGTGVRVSRRWPARWARIRRRPAARSRRSRRATSM